MNEDKQASSASPSNPTRSDNDKIEELHTLTNRLANELERSRIAQYTELLNRPWKLIGLNLLSGAARGVGIAIGFTFCSHHHLCVTGAGSPQSANRRRLYCRYRPYRTASA